MKRIFFLCGLLAFACSGKRLPDHYGVFYVLDGGYAEIPRMDYEARGYGLSGGLTLRTSDLDAERLPLVSYPLKLVIYDSQPVSIDTYVLHPDVVYEPESDYVHRANVRKVDDELWEMIFPELSEEIMSEYFEQMEHLVFQDEVCPSILFCLGNPEQKRGYPFKLRAPEGLKISEPLKLEPEKTYDAKEELQLGVKVDDKNPVVGKHITLTVDFFWLGDFDRYDIGAFDTPSAEGLEYLGSSRDIFHEPFGKDDSITVVSYKFEFLPTKAGRVFIDEIVAEYVDSSTGSIRKIGKAGFAINVKEPQEE